MRYLLLVIIAGLAILHGTEQQAKSDPEKLNIPVEEITKLQK